MVTVAIIFLCVCASRKSSDYLYMPYNVTFWNCLFLVCSFSLNIVINIFYILLRLHCARLNKAMSCVYCSVLSGGECVKQCPQQTFSDTTGWRCQPCHRSCQTCHGPHSTDCNLCLDENPPLHGQCPMVNCPLGQYYDGKRKNQILLVFFSE